MIDLIVGLIVVFLTTPKEDQNYNSNQNEEIIRPILMEGFTHDTSDTYEYFGD